MELYHHEATPAPPDAHTHTHARAHVPAGARDVVFFMHGVLDTSLGWVANGSVGSQAFGAWDSGADVWLGNSRNNAPRLHVGERAPAAVHPAERKGGGSGLPLPPRQQPPAADPSSRPRGSLRCGSHAALCCADEAVRRSGRYWHYTANELACADLAALVSRIHEVKLAELRVSPLLSPLPPTRTHTRTRTTPQGCWGMCVGDS